MEMTILMVRPVRFGYNEETAVNNTFQADEGRVDVQDKALEEFEAFVELLKSHDIDVLVVDDTPQPYTPDSIFPNNWISFHDDGTVVLYPMFAENRRLERKPTVFEAVARRFSIRETIDYTAYEAEGKFLEGTGSFILDREHQVAYACLSPRTDEELFDVFCKQLGYKPIVFRSLDQLGTPIYHTNVMMCVADRYAVVNLESIPEPDRGKVVAALEGSGKAIVPITHGQMNQFAGNMLQVRDRRGKRYLVMSSQAYHSLTRQQIAQLTSFDPIIHAPLETIEKNGGGSARCMMAEIFLPHF